MLLRTEGMNVLADLCLYGLHTTKRDFLTTWLILYAPRREKTCLRWFANKKGTDKPAHTGSLISTSVIRLLESIKSKFAKGEILLF